MDIPTWRVLLLRDFCWIRKADSRKSADPCAWPDRYFVPDAALSAVPQQPYREAILAQFPGQTQQGEAPAQMCTASKGRAGA